MNEKEADRFKLFTQVATAHWHETIKLLGSIDEGDYLADYIRQEYHVVKKGKQPEYILVPHHNRLAHCEGCGNEFGWCGTPCVICDKAEKWDEGYGMFMHFKEFTIYKKKSELS